MLQFELSPPCDDFFPLTQPSDDIDLRAENPDDEEAPKVVEKVTQKKRSFKF